MAIAEREVVIPYRAPKVYRYQPYPKVAGFLLAPLLCLIVVGLAVFFIQHDFPGVAILFFAWAGVILAFVGYSLLTYSRIAVSDDQIAALSIFGGEMRTIRWENVKKVRKLRVWNTAVGTYQDRFYIYDDARKFLINLRGPIVFTDELVGLGELLDTINQRSYQHQFAPVALDQDSEPPAKAG